MLQSGSVARTLSVTEQSDLAYSLPLLREPNLGLGLAVVARIIRNMNGQMRLKSEIGKGSRFVLQFPFDLPDGEEHIEMAMHSPEGEPPDHEVTLIQKDTTAPSPRSDSSLEKRMSSESLISMNSKRSIRSAGSGQSGRSDVDRQKGVVVIGVQPQVLLDERKLD